jgi:hypothetical protein
VASPVDWAYNDTLGDSEQLSPAESNLSGDAAVLGHTLLVCCLFLGQPAAAGEKDAALEEKVKKLVRQLDHDELAKRVAAEKELVELGPPALELLPPITARTPAEVKDRLDRVRKALETAAVEAATKPTLVTLQGEMTLSEALAAIEKQTKNRIVDYREKFNQESRTIKIKLDLDKRPFWEALDKVLDEAQMTTYNFGGEPHTVFVVARGDAELPRSDRAGYGGLFRFEGTQVEAVRNLRNPAVRSLKLTIDAAWEPRISPIVLEQARDETTATDSEGNAIEIDGREGRLDVAVQGDVSAVTFELPLVLPDRGVKKIASLKGKITALVPGRVETFKFDNLTKSKNVEQKRAGVTVLLEQVHKNVEVHEVRMRVIFDKAANALESHRGWIYNNEAYLLDPRGERVEIAGLEATRQEINEVGVAYKFVPEGDLTGHTFVYKTPAAIVKMPVQFELKEIDLP